jgi:hypothetical protein
MDPRLSLLPYSAQYAVEDAVNALHRCRQALRERRRATDRATDRGRAAAIRAGRLLAKMRDVR